VRSIVVVAEVIGMLVALMTIPVVFGLGLRAILLFFSDL
jgi:hypothetical protein